MKTRFKSIARRISRSYRSFMNEYLAYFGLGEQGQQPTPESPELCLPF